MDKKFALAVETAVGGFLRNIIVENTDVVNELITKKCVAYRTNYLPLDNIKSNICPKEVIELAKEAGEKRGSKVWHALEIINTNNNLKFSKVLEMGFSNFFICENLETANAIAFDPKIRKIAVTLDGDKSDPEGFIGGGVNPYAFKTEFMKWLAYKECKGDLERLTNDKRILQR